MLFLALKKVLPPDKKIPVLTKIPPSPTGRGGFSLTPLMIFGKPWPVSPFQHEV